MDEARPTLLDADEPPPFTVEHADGTSPFFLTADHAGRLLPRRLGDLGVSAAELQRHIAWDIGIAGVSRRLADRLNAFLILQTYSRLVIDCNRSPEVDSSICVVSERPSVVEIVSWAAGNGDRSENGDYLYGKKRLREIDRRIRFLLKRLEIAEVVDQSRQTNRDQVFFGATVTYADNDFAVLRVVGADWMFHAAHTYRDNPVIGLIEGVTGRGAGVELWLYGVDPDAAEAAARDGGYTVLAGAMDKPHGLREAIILDDNGYCWVPGTPNPKDG